MAPRFVLAFLDRELVGAAGEVAAKMIVNAHTFQVRLATALAMSVDKKSGPVRKTT